MEDDGSGGYRPPSPPASVEIPALCSQANEPFAIRMTPCPEGGWDLVFYVPPGGAVPPTVTLHDFEGPFRMGEDFHGCPVCGETREPVLLVCECGQVFCSRRADRRLFRELTATCPSCGATTGLRGTATSMRGRETQ